MIKKEYIIPDIRVYQIGCVAIMDISTPDPSWTVQNGPSGDDDQDEDEDDENL